MKNSEKYKTIKERDDAFNTFCRSHKGCRRCPLEEISHCTFAWLEMKTNISEEMVSHLITEVYGEDILSREEMVKKLLSHREEIQQIWQEQDREKKYAKL